MPSTLVHLGIQGFATRAVVPRVDLRLVYMSCVIPDLPWVVQRALYVLWPELDRIALMLTCSVQASLVFCLVLGGAFAVLARRPGYTFLVLATGSLAHLLLDALQVKWGRGVILFAPVDWQPVSFGLFWPEHPLSHAVLAASAIFVVATWRKIDHSPLFRGPSAGRWLVAVVLASFYAIGPYAFTDELEENDVFSAATVADVEGRVGKPAAFDRAPLLPQGNDGLAMEVFSGERIRLEGVPVDSRGLISAMGRFVAPHVFRVETYHLHPPHLRLAASAVGLLAVVLLWAQTAMAWIKRRRGAISPPRPGE